MILSDSDSSSSISFKYFKFIFSNFMFINSINNPYSTDETINALFKNPSTEKESLIKIVEMIKPEFLKIS